MQMRVAKILLRSVFISFNIFAYSQKSKNILTLSN